MPGCCGRLRRCSVRKGLVGGVAVLLIVDVLWVGSAGLTRFLFTQESYDKPLFTVYFKTTLFTIYLVAFIFWRPWQRLCKCGRGQRNIRHKDVGPGSHSKLQPHLSSSVVDSPCDVNEQTGQCEYNQEARVMSDHGKGEQEKEGEWGEDRKRYFHVPGDLSVDVCPIEPEHKTCLLGPPEFEPLGCYEIDEDSEHERTKPLPPCRSKSCRVRFKPTIEVREAQGNSSFTIESSDIGSGERARRAVELLPISRVALMALIFGIVWFFANYLYALALEKTSVAAVNTLSSMSGVFVMVLAAIPILHVTDGDRFTLSRLLVTLLSVGGAVMVSFSPSSSSGDEVESHKGFNVAALYAVGGAALYAIYLVLLRKLVAVPDSLEIPMFFGFVGLFDTILLLPLVIIWHFSGIEVFELPPSSDVWTLLLVNGFVGTVLSELLWLWGVFLTSPLLGTLNLSLVTPLSIAYSIVVGKAHFSWMFTVGAVFILLAFIGVTILEHYGAWDPVWVAIKATFTAAREISIQSGFYSLSEESQRLLSRGRSSECVITDLH